MYFDDACLLCNRAVVFLAKRIQNQSLCFAPIGGITYQKLLTNYPELKQQDTVIVAYQNQIYTRSKALFVLIEQLPWPYQLILIASYLPTRLTDFCYNVVAKFRPRKSKLHCTCSINPKIQILP